MDIELLFSVLILHIMALISPGPDLILTIKNTISFGKDHGLITALGFSFGIGIHCLYSVHGLSWLVSSIPSAPLLLKILGPSYLIWIGIYGLFKENSPFKLNHHKDAYQFQRKLKKSFLEGLMTNLLNPKAGLFILSLLSGLLSKKIYITSLYILSFSMMTLTMLWFSFVTYIFGNELIQKKYLIYSAYFNSFFSIFFIVTGIVLMIY